MKALQFAYADHRPIIISPDMIWLLFCQGFSKHIELNSEKYRNRIVNFEGKKEILVVRNDFVFGKTDSIWHEVVREFSLRSKDHIIDKKMHSTVVHEFSTTTEKELLAFDITFLEINKHYFDYTFWACGIPEITVEGTTQDWQWIRDNVEYFKDYDLSWWIDELIPIIDQFVNASKGDIDLNFWSKIYRYDEFCNKEITGWGTKFFPYLRKGSDYFKNPLLFHEPIDKGMYFEHAIENENFTSGLSNVDFKFIDHSKEEHKLRFVGGFVGIKQDKKTKALRPEINWMVTRRKTK
jgi:hypothetical protein